MTKGIDEAPDEETISRAAEWHIRLQAEDAEDQRLACERWCAKRPSHAMAFARMGELWQCFDRVRQLPQGAAARVLSDTGAPKAKRAMARATLFGAALLAGMLALVGGKVPGVSWMLADYRTGIGEQRTVTLSDGSSVTLNTQSAIDVSFDASQRRVLLKRGEIMVTVQKDVARPFVVETPQATARALGTRYAVWRDGDVTEVTVIESSVRVCTTQITTPGTPVDSCMDIVAGQRIRVGADGLEAPHAIDTIAAESWTQGILLIDDRPLADVLRVLQQHRAGWIGFDEQALQHLRVSGAFPLRDTDRALDVLAATHPIALRRYGVLYARVEVR